MDILTDILRAQRLQGTVYFRADFREPWGLDIRGGEFANFHIVAQGRCWVSTDAQAEALALEQGDVIMFPHGTPHSLLHAPDGIAQPAAELLDNGVKDSNGRPVFGGQGSVTTTLICGHFDYDRRYAHPLLETLPKQVHVQASQHGNAEWISTAGRLAVAESAAKSAATGVIVDRLAEALLVQALVGYVSTLTGHQTRNFLAAIQDRAIGQVLSLIHQDITRSWTLDELSQAAGVSKSVFTDRFRHLVGESPIAYIARWRMLKARELLLDTPLAVAQVAEAVGYESEFAFSKAFKRLYGIPPGGVRVGKSRV